MKGQAAREPGRRPPTRRQRRRRPGRGPSRAATAASLLLRVLARGEFAAPSRPSGAARPRWTCSSSSSGTGRTPPIKRRKGWEASPFTSWDRKLPSTGCAAILIDKRPRRPSGQNERCAEAASRRTPPLTTTGLPVRSRWWNGWSSRVPSRWPFRTSAGCSPCTFTGTLPSSIPPGPTSCRVVRREAPGPSITRSSSDPRGATWSRSGRTGSRLARFRTGRNTGCSGCCTAWGPPLLNFFVGRALRLRIPERVAPSPGTPRVAPR
jgi:hypothetical protein